MITITLPYPPSANRYWRMVKGRIIVSAEAKAYKMRVGLMCAASKLRPLVGDVSLSVEVYRPAKRGDLDNTLKILQDSLRGFAFVDDSQVVEIYARRGDDKDNPRAVVTVGQIDT